MSRTPSSSPAQPHRKSSPGDPVWDHIRREVQQDADGEPILSTYLYETVLIHDTMEEALSSHLANLLESPRLHAITIRELLDEAFQNDPSISVAIREDITAIVDRDPAAERYSVPFLYLKGFHALTAHRAAHYYWNLGRRTLARFFQSQVSQVFAVDIHPAARIGHGILMDHATGIVIGETAVVENNVSMLHEVTLGGTGKVTGDRHPKVREGVLISAGAKILGNVEIGAGAKIGGGAVVLDNVPPHTTAVGVPAVIVGHPESDQPALEMNHRTPIRAQDDNG